MSRHITPNARTIATLAVSLIALSATAVMAQTIQGTASYRERMTLPPGAVEAALEDVSRADAPAATIASTRVTSPGNPPIAFTIGYDPTVIVQAHRYVVRARIVVDGKLLFTSDTATPVITQGNPTTVSLMLRRAGAGQPAGDSTAPPAQPSAPLSLEGIYWRATEVAGKATPGKGYKQEAHLQFHSGGRVTGSDGCNRINGTYEVKGAAITFGGFAATQMACPGTDEIQRAFREMLKATSRYAITGSRLELFDKAGTRAASFDAVAPPPAV